MSFKPILTCAAMVRRWKAAGLKEGADFTADTKDLPRSTWAADFVAGTVRLNAAQPSAEDAERGFRAFAEALKRGATPADSDDQKKPE